MSRRMIGVVALLVCGVMGGGVAAMAALFMAVTMGSSQVSSAAGGSPRGCEVNAPGQPVALGGEGMGSDEQMANAKTIVEAGLKLQVPERGLVVAIATAIQESTLRNLNYGDRDSVGLFQQRAPWGSREERTDPATSAALFFSGGSDADGWSEPGLLDTKGWQVMSIAGAAQAVQRSAFPDAYARWESVSALAVEQILGGGPEQVCTIEAVPVAGSCPVSSDLSGYPNGQIPSRALCKLKFAKGHQLRSDAALAAEKLSVAYEQRFKSPLCVTDSYRSLAAQIDVYARKPGLAARPGTSNHGLGVAMDLCGGIQSFGTAEHEWMQANAPAFGWIHPSWAGLSGSRPEAWHWSFGVE